VLAVVESILEQPMPVLTAQVQREKSAAIAEMKAAGMEYEERMERLQQITWPKPLANWLYDDADRFAALHPWLPEGAVKPKSIAREMVEQLLGFDDYVRDLNLEPAEGVLLRYLSQVYKTLLQNVPDRWRSPGVWEAIGHLRAVIGQTDSSLVQEWEAMREGRQFVEPDRDPLLAVSQQAAEKTREKSLRARIGAEALQLVRWLARGDFAAAELAIATGSGDGHWSASRLQDAWAQAEAEHGELVAVPNMRQTEHCKIVRKDRDIWQLEQTLFGPEGPTDGRLLAEIDLRGEDDGPLLWLEELR
jgi:hypothetical protein